MTPVSSHETGAFYTPRRLTGLVIPVSALAVNTGQFTAISDDLRFCLSQCLKSAANFGIIAVRLRQTNICRVVPRLRFVKAAVKIAQLRVLQMIPQQNETFATAGFNKPGDKKTIDRLVRFLTAT